MGVWYLAGRREAGLRRLFLWYVLLAHQSDVKISDINDNRYQPRVIIRGRDPS